MFVVKFEWWVFLDDLENWDNGVCLYGGGQFSDIFYYFFLFRLSFLRHGNVSRLWARTNLIINGMLWNLPELAHLQKLSLPQPVLLPQQFPMRHYHLQLKCSVHEPTRLHQNISLDLFRPLFLSRWHTMTIHRCHDIIHGHQSEKTSKLHPDSSRRLARRMSVIKDPRKEKQNTAKIPRWNNMLAGWWATQTFHLPEGLFWLCLLTQVVVGSFVALPRSCSLLYKEVATVSQTIDQTSVLLFIHLLLTLSLNQLSVSIQRSLEMLLPPMHASFCSEDCGGNWSW